MFSTLIVEDHSPFRRLLLDVLGVRVPSLSLRAVSTGEAAIAEIRRRPPNLVITDLRLPGLSGLSLSREIKSEYPETRLIIFTGNDLPEYRAAARRLGAEHFLSKETSSLDELVEVVESIAGRPTEDE